MLRTPLAFNTQATRPPAGAADRPDGKGALMTCSSANCFSWAWTRLRLFASGNDSDAPKNTMTRSNFFKADSFADTRWVGNERTDYTAESAPMPAINSKVLRGISSSCWYWFNLKFSFTPGFSQVTWRPAKLP